MYRTESPDYRVRPVFVSEDNPTPGSPILAGCRAKNRAARMPWRVTT